MKYGDLKLGQIEALINIIGGMEAVERILAKTVKVVLEAMKLLTPVDKPIPVPDVSEFVLTEDMLKQANIYSWDYFKGRFLNKKCPAAKAANVHAHRLEQRSMDKPIMEALGKGVQTSLGHFLWLVQNGALSKDYVSIFYIMDDEGVVWAVDCRWNAGCREGDVNAHSVEDASGWDEGGQVFSSDS